jgi:hypothetical protein
MTEHEKAVKEKWPDARSERCQVCGGTHIYNGEFISDTLRIVGTGRNANAAWKDAASRVAE